MSSEKIKFRDKVDSVDLSKIVVTSGWKLNDATNKYFCGYLNNDGIIKP